MVGVTVCFFSFRDILERLLLIEVEVLARPSEDEDAFVGSIAFSIYLCITFSKMSASSVPNPPYIPICKANHDIGQVRIKCMSPANRICD